LFLYFAKWTFISNAPLYVQEVYAWTPEKAGVLTTTWGISQFTVMLACPSLDRFLGTRGLAWLGLTAGLVAMVIAAVTFVDWMIVPAMGIGAISMLTYTALAATGARLVHPSLSGEVQGLLSTVLDFTEVLGPVTFGTLLTVSLKYKEVAAWAPNVPFMVGAVFVLVALALHAAGIPEPDDGDVPLQDSAAA